MAYPQAVRAPHLANSGNLPDCNLVLIPVLSVCQTAATFTIFGGIWCKTQGWRTTSESNDNSGPANFPDLENSRNLLWWAGQPREPQMTSVTTDQRTVLINPPFKEARMAPTQTPGL